MVCSCVSVSVNAVKLLSFVPSLLGNTARYLAGLARSGTDVLSDEANRLEAIRVDINKAVSAQESIQFRKRKQQVEQWMQDVADLLNEVTRFKASRIHSIPCLKDCPCWATDLLQRVRRLTTDGESLKELLGEEPLQRTNEVPNPPIFVGRQEVLSEVRGLVANSDIKIIGIYGMPGIGKTALLQKIYHELSDPNHQGGGGRGGDPSRVMFAKVSQEPNILNLQKDILRELGLPFAEDGPSDSSGRESQQARALFRELSTRNTILLLDDVWERLDWDEIGIPSPDVYEATCKIIFTTPFRQVCKEMAPVAEGIIKMGFLSDQEAWELFCLKSKKAEDDPSIKPAKPVIKRCGGLPRAVITVSNHMACSASHRECEEMTKKLRCSPHEINGMKDKVLFPLKCIFDKLEENNNHKLAVEMRQCLLYCSLFPEDRNIYIEQLIDYWVGEGFLDAECYLNLPAVRDRGHEIIRTLADECFLESTCDDDHKEVKLHDVVRGMALWLTDGESEQSRLFLTSNRLKESTNRRWEKAERISSMGNGLKVFPSNIIKCPHLLTFLFNNYNIHLEFHGNSPIQQYHLNHCTEHRASVHQGLSNIQGEPRNLFKFAGALKVLDLSGTKIESLPAEIGSIDELQYLNVSYTNIRELPKELSKLKKLRQLKLRGTPHLSKIPKKSIPPETILQIFDLFDSSYCWRPSTGINLLGGDIKLDDFSRWSFLNEIGLTIATSPSLESLCSSEKLSRSIVFLKLQDVGGLSIDHLSSVFRIMRNLRELSVSGTNMPNLEISTGQLPKLELMALCNLASLSTIDVIEDAGRLLQSLRHLHICNCHQLTHITWVHRLPSLVEIALSNCYGIEELVNGQVNCFLSEKLREIHLKDLPKFERISYSTLRLPSLEIISVSSCSLFWELSIDGETARNVKEIRGEQQWWDGLQGDEIKSILENCFKLNS